MNDTVGRPTVPEHRVTIRNVVEWQGVRARHDQYAKDPDHMVKHILKVLGRVAENLEHRDHGEVETPLDQRRYADLIICAIWLAENEGVDAAAAVANRMWDLGIGPKREELPADEREVMQ